MCKIIIVRGGRSQAAVDKKWTSKTGINAQINANNDDRAVSISAHDCLFILAIRGTSNQRRIVIVSGNISVMSAR